MASLSTHHITIEDRSAGTPKLGFMLAKRNGRRNLTIADYPTLVPRILSDAERNQLQLPPEVESVWYESDWRDGMGGMDSQDTLRIAEGYRIDTSIKGRMQLSRLFKVSTVDIVPNEYKPSGFSEDPGGSGILWGFIGETDTPNSKSLLYKWDYTNKNWDAQISATDLLDGILRNGVPYGARAYIPRWTAATDVPTWYAHVTNGALTEMGNTAGEFRPKYFAVANGSLWAGYITTTKHAIRSATDPTAYANWGTAITIGTADSEITNLVGLGGDLYVCKTNGLWLYDADATTPTATNLTPEFEKMVHPDNFRASLAWNDAVIIAPGVGGLRSYYLGVLYDISPALAMPEQTQFHGRICALAGDATALFALVLDTTNLKYHVLMMIYQEMVDGSFGYAWHHIGSITYVTSTVANHATMFVESVNSGANTHHRLWVGVESGGSNLLPYFYTITTHDIEHTFNHDNDGYAITVKDDHNFPQVNKRYGSVTFETVNCAAASSTAITSNEAVDDSETEIDLSADPTGTIAVNDTVQLTGDAEMMRVTAISAAPANMTVTRGVLGTTAATHTTGKNVKIVGHHIYVQYRVDGGAWTAVTGDESTSRLTTSPQTLTFPAEITGKYIEFRFYLYQGTTTTTTPHLKSFRLKFQIRVAAVKSLPLVVSLADGVSLLNGLPSNSSGSDLTQLESWNTQAGEVVVRIPKGPLPTGTAYNMVFVPGSLRIQEIEAKHGSRPAYEAKFTLVSVD